MTIPPGPIGGAPLSIPAGILSAFTVISTLAELDAIAPAGPGGVRALNTPGCVLVTDAIDLPVGERIVVGPDTVLRGCDADVSGLRGAVNAPLVSGSDGLVVTDIFLRNLDPGAGSYCLEASNGGGPGARIVRIQDVSVGGTRGLRIFDTTAGSVQNLLSRATDHGIVLAGITQGVQIVDCVFPPDSPATPTYLSFRGLGHFATRVTGCVFVLEPGALGLEIIGAPTIALLRASNNDFIPDGGTPVAPAGMADSQPDVYFFGNTGTQNSTFGGGMAYNGNVPLGATVVPGVGVVQAGGELTNAVRVGAGDPASPLFALTGASARVALIQPGITETAMLAWAALEPSDVQVDASVSVRSIDMAPRAFGVQVVRLPGGVGPAQFVGSFTGSTGVVPQTSGFAAVSAGVSGMEPGDTLALELANLTDGDPLIVEAANLTMRATS